MISTNWPGQVLDLILNRNIDQCLFDHWDLTLEWAKALGCPAPAQTKTER
jgi:hypothetical protein